MLRDLYYSEPNTWTHWKEYDVNADFSDSNAPSSVNYFRPGKDTSSFTLRMENTFPKIDIETMWEMDQFENRIKWDSRWTNPRLIQEGAGERGNII